MTPLDYHGGRWAFYKWTDGEWGRPLRRAGERHVRPKEGVLLPFCGFWTSSLWRHSSAGHPASTGEPGQAGSSRNPCGSMLPGPQPHFCSASPGGLNGGSRTAQSHGPHCPLRSSRLSWAYDGGQVTQKMPACSVASAVSRLSVTPWTAALQTLLSMRFSRQEYWSGLPYPSRGDLPSPGIEPVSLISPALAGGFFTTSTTWKAPEDAQWDRKLPNFPASWAEPTSVCAPGLEDHGLTS